MLLRRIRERHDAAQAGEDEHHRAATEAAIEKYLRIPKQSAAFISLPTFPLGIDSVRLQRVGSAMSRFGLLPTGSKCQVSRMIGGYPARVWTQTGWLLLRNRPVAGIADCTCSPRIAVRPLRGFPGLTVLIAVAPVLGCGVKFTLILGHIGLLVVAARLVGSATCSTWFTAHAACLPRGPRFIRLDHATITEATQ